MSLSLHRPKHATVPTPPPDWERRAITAESEVRALRVQLGRAAADSRQWKFRAIQAEHVLANLPAALANPDALIRRLFAEAETAKVALAEAKAQLAQHQPATTEDGTQ